MDTVPVEPTSSGGSNSQTVIIIILIIIGLILFFYFLIELVRIPPVTIAPFTNGAKIKIKSLTNDLYLRPLACSDIPNCTSIPVCPDASVVVADGQRGDVDSDTTWILCQYQSPPAGGVNPNAPVAAAYSIVSGSEQNGQLMSTLNAVPNPLEGNLVFLGATGEVGSCLNLSTAPPTCSIMRLLFSFDLIAANGGNNKSVGSNVQGVYFIHSIPPDLWVSGGCANDLPENAAGNSYYYLNGAQPAPSTCQVPLIQLILSDGAGDRFDRSEILGYSFEVEVVGQVGS